MNQEEKIEIQGRIIDSVQPIANLISAIRDGRDADTVNELMGYAKESLEELSSFDFTGLVKPNIDTSPVIGYTPTKRDYFTAMAMQGLLAGRTEYEDSQSGLQTAVESADFIIDKLK